MSEIDHFFCSDIAREFQIPLIGTATQGDVWFLLEYDGRWESKAFEASSIPDEVKKHLSEGNKVGKDPRIQLIRQNHIGYREKLHFFIGLPTPENPKLYEFHIQEYADILKIDVASFIAGTAETTQDLREDPLFLVCTNGKRDRCCARYGFELYQSMSEVDSSNVWQSSHIGGHNKAPVTLFFPHGVNYGNTSPGEILHLMDEYKNGRISLRKLRGRVCYPPHIQASEYFWRKETGNYNLSDMHIKSVEQVSEKEWRVTITGKNDSSSRQFTIQGQDSTYQIPVTCSREKIRPVTSFHIIDSITPA